MCRQLDLWAELEKSEAIVEKGPQTFIEVGRELLRIRDLKLYQAKNFSNFEAHCKQRWEHH
jgi:hypothetical protein